MEHVENAGDSDRDTVYERIVFIGHAAEHVVGVDVENRTTVANPDREKVCKEKLYWVEVQVEQNAEM